MGAECEVIYSSFRGRVSGLDVESQTRYYVNSETSEQASGSTMGYEDEVVSLESG